MISSNIVIIIIISSSSSVITIIHIISIISSRREWGVGDKLFERLPEHRHRNLKAFEEHLQEHVSSRFVAE